MSYVFRKCPRSRYLESRLVVGARREASHYPRKHGTVWDRTRRIGMSEVELRDEVTTDDFDFTVEPADSPQVEIIETIDENVLSGTLTARCN